MVACTIQHRPGLSSASEFDSDFLFMEWDKISSSKYHRHPDGTVTENESVLFVGFASVGLTLMAADRNCGSPGLPVRCTVQETGTPSEPPAAIAKAVALPTTTPPFPTICTSNVAPSAPLNSCPVWPDLQTFLSIGSFRDVGFASACAARTR
jgi:hypothetical protein